ncbi:hypothetical protein, partial [Actinoplanes sp. DH11]|uniref:hypothetical protein n=1 Tax=Actinoplanes sp. DH11 TaxID=2857011 RepID=UPI001E4E786D
CGWITSFLRSNYPRKRTVARDLRMSGRGAQRRRHWLAQAGNGFMVSTAARSVEILEVRLVEAISTLLGI